MAIDVKEAVRLAEAYAKSLYPDLAFTMLEEVEFVDRPGPGHWSITLSFRLKNDPIELVSHTAKLAESITGIPAPRSSPTHYRVFKIDAGGTISSMKMRKVDE
jgi:hypothetical protein